MAYDGRYKLTIFSGTREPVELFDTGRDPDELINRVNDPALASVRQALLDKHLSYLTGRMNKEKYEIFRQGLLQQIEAGRQPKWAQGISFFKP